jgi:hypothetical protein
MQNRVRWLFILILLAIPYTIYAGEHSGHVPMQRERPDDPPGEPARPMPGARRSAPVAQGSYVSVQANVSPFGLNVVGDAANEPSIAVDPNNPNRMAIGWRQFDTSTSNFRQAGWAHTRDGGRTWTFPGVLDPGVFRSDPVLSYNAQGIFYYNSLKVVGSAFTCDVFTSANQGVTWSAPVYAQGGDKQWMTVDRTGGVGDGHIYCAWSTAAGCCGNNTFTRSVDGAVSFETASAIPFTPVWGTLDVAADGSLFVGGISPSDVSLFLAARSTNAKIAGVTPIFGTIPVAMNGSVLFGVTGGPNPGGLLGQVSLAVDPSTGSTGGYVYMLCSVDPPGPDPMDVHFVRSTDAGTSWGAPVRVNDDVGEAWQWFGTMSVSPDGRIDAIWNDTRNTGVSNQSELHYASSTDGGVTWSANIQVSPAFDSWVGWPNQNKIGDYYDMVSDRVGASLAWAATFNNEQDVYYLRIGDYDCNTNGVGDSLDIALGTSPDIDFNGIPDECEGTATASRGDVPPRYRLYQNVPNPFNLSTTIRFDVAEDGGRVTLQIFDVRGSLVRTLLDAPVGAGDKSVRWDGRDDAGSAVATGVYLYRLNAPGFTETRKMLLLK